MKPSFPAAPVVERAAEPTETEHPRAGVRVFMTACAADPLLGPVFDATLAGRWDDHLPKMCTFWASLVLGAKQYRGNVQQAHQAARGSRTRSISAAGCTLFLDTASNRATMPAAAVRFMEPALRIAQSLQLSRFGGDYVDSGGTAGVARTRGAEAASGGRRTSIFPHSPLGESVSDAHYR